jgi:hypothetical protein
MAAREGVGIKVKIGLKPNGHALYPNWALLPMVKGGITPESQQIVKWQYDKSSGHTEDGGGESPVGQQNGMMIVTEQFANEAIAMFPAVSIMTNAEVESFWNNKAHAHVSKDSIDSRLLGDLNIELALRRSIGENTTALEQRIAKALNRNDEEPGLKKNKSKTFADAKGHLGFKMKP